MRFIVVKDRVRREANEKGFEVTNDVFKELDYRVRELLRDGIKRAEENNRKTLMGRDI